MESEIPEETPIVLVPEARPERKHVRLNKWHVIAVVLVAVIAIQGFMYVSLNSRFNTLNADHKSLTAENKDLESDYNSLQSDFDSLQSEYGTLQSTYDSYVSSYDYLRTQINARTLQLLVRDFITPEDSTVKNKVVQITGGWSDPSDWNECWDDMKKMYDWIVNNIEYRSDGLSPVLPTTPSGYLEYSEEMWQFPSETLDLLQGDCEDMAILLTSMILSYNEGKYRTECVMIEGSTDGHAGVQMPVADDKLTILDPAGKYYTQTSGNIDNKDISTEINSWLNYWKPQMGNDVHVVRVFSDSLDKSFSSTSEYTSWMYSR